ncbi:glycosyltransferase [Lactovum miscens]|uniref:GT2 family glycosyltransferase n=1 Tax=Lactovum miscens TaxID=190387 RepID=A0A841C5Q1_9LACT|nr:glycosyltransferase [Lactovum miscens]MBB5887674.1 GT2 family glycosyltransferase [Lactovum miscens]
MSETLDISVVIPFKDKPELTIKAIETFRAYGPSVREVLLISNNSSKESLTKLSRLIEGLRNIKILEYNIPFNYQKINNWAISKSTGKFILMMNNDIELDENSNGLIEKMYYFAKDSAVGICGATLLYGDKKHIQHAGVFLHPEGMADHMYVKKKYSSAVNKAGTIEFPYDVQKNIKMTAVTGAFQLIEKSKFDSVNGFDERFIIGGGDVDLCIRLNKKGYQTWFIGGGYLIHKESMSRRFTPIPYSDFYYSYLSYINGYDVNVGDPFLPEITKKIIINGA